MKGKRGDIARDIGRLCVSNDQSAVRQHGLSSDNGTLFAALRRPRATPARLFISEGASRPTHVHSPTEAGMLPVLKEPLYLRVIHTTPAWVFSHFGF